MNDLQKRYDDLKEKVVERKEQFSSLMDYLETETSWLTAPASTRFHLCREGGLLEHSVNVAEILLKIKAVLYPDVSDESCVIVALLHDLGKVGMPGKPQYIKNVPSEKQKMWGYSANYPFRFNTSLTFLSVPVRSLFLAMQHLSLTDEEAQAIVYHDGQYVEDNRSCAKKEEPLTLLLQYADNWCGFIVEKDQ